MTQRFFYRFASLVTLLWLAAAFMHSTRAAAEPLHFGLSESLPPATSLAKGACGVAAEASAGVALTSVADAQTVLRSAPITSTKAFVVMSADYANGLTGSSGDFGVDTPMPFSRFGQPPGAGTQVVMRWTGWVAIHDPGPRTFAIRSDDGFSLKIAGVNVVAHSGARPSRIDTREVTFDTAGFYPFELVYFNGREEGILEWSQATGALGEVVNSVSLPMKTAFAPLTGDRDLRSAWSAGTGCEDRPLPVTFDGGVPATDASILVDGGSAATSDGGPGQTDHGDAANGGVDDGGLPHLLSDAGGDAEPDGTPRLGSDASAQTSDDTGPPASDDAGPRVSPDHVDSGSTLSGLDGGASSGGIHLLGTPGCSVTRARGLPPWLLWIVGCSALWFMRRARTKARPRQS